LSKGRGETWRPGGEAALQGEAVFNRLLDAVAPRRIEPSR
jgi:hypothetical protein